MTANSRSEWALPDCFRKKEGKTNKENSKSRDTHLAGGEERRGQKDKKRWEKGRTGKDRKGKKIEQKTNLMNFPFNSGKLARFLDSHFTDFFIVCLKNFPE